MAHFGVFGRSRATLITHWISGAILGEFWTGVPTDWEFLLGVLLAHFLAHGRLMLHFSSFFLRYFFEARFFIDFGWPQGSKNDAFGGGRHG